MSGAIGKELDALREKAREMGAKTKFSASEAAEAMNYMAMAGWKTRDMLDGIEGIMNLAAASGEDLATISDIVTDALTALGLRQRIPGILQISLRRQAGEIQQFYYSQFVYLLLQPISSLDSLYLLKALHKST